MTTQHIEDGDVVLSEINELVSLVSVENKKSDRKNVLKSQGVFLLAGIVDVGDEGFAMQLVIAFLLGINFS